MKSADTIEYDDTVSADDDSSEGIYRAARELYKETVESCHEEIQESRDDFRFLNGDNHWTDEEVRERNENKRPCLTINRLPAFLDQVVADLRQNRFEIKVLPVDDSGDEKIAEIYNGIIRNVARDSAADNQYILATENTVACGYGYLRVFTEYEGEHTFNQKIKVKAVRDPFSVLLDPMTTEIDGSDAKYAFIISTMTKKDFRREYPDKPCVSWDNEMLTSPSRNDDHTINVVEYLWIEKKPDGTLYLLSNGESVRSDELADYTLAQLQEMTTPEGSPILLTEGVIKAVSDDPWATLGDMGIEKVNEREITKPTVKTMLMNGAGPLEDPQEWAGRYLPVIPVYGKELYVDGQIKRRGVIRHAKDPQRLLNFWKTYNAEFIALQPMAPIVTTAEQIGPYAAQWAMVNKYPLPYLLYQNDPKNPGAPRRLDPPRGSIDAYRNEQISVDDIKATLGIYDASLGAQGNETSGRAILARQREGAKSTFAFQDNLAMSLEYLGRVLVDLIPRIYDADRVVRIVGENDETRDVRINAQFEEMDETGQVISKIYDLSTGRYDVTVAVGPHHATARQESQEFILNLLQTMPGAGPYIADLLVKNSDVAESDEIVKRLKAINPLFSNQPSPGIPPGTQIGNGGMNRFPEPGGMPAQ